MKRLCSLLLALIFLLTGCTKPAPVPETPEFGGLQDPNLHRYVQDSLYSDLVERLEPTEYYVENVGISYVSQEYLEELDYNSQENLYFGYSLSDLDQQFQGQRYVFTLDDQGKTTVKAMETYDDTMDRILRNVAIGGGVILVCVTVSLATGAAAPAVSMIFAAAAKTGTTMALSSGALSGLCEGVLTGIQTGDWEAAAKQGLLAGSDGFKWGAIGGTLAGGASKAVALHGATLNGLTMNEAAAIQKESKYPLDVIREFKSTEQYKICKEAGLKTQMVNGKTALIRDIDLKFKDTDGLTNLERMQHGKAALDPQTGLPYELHHIGQKVDSTLSILTQGEHRLGGNSAIWHDNHIHNGVHAAGNHWDAQRAAFWKSLSSLLE